MKGSDKAFPFFRGKIRLLQGRKHRVSVDLVVFLSRLRGLRRTSRVVDLGAGFGFLSLVVAKKFGCRVFALERDPEMLRLLQENVRLNDLEEKITVVPVDIRKVRERFERGEFDVAIANPPFFPRSYGCADKYHFEEDTTLGDFVGSASYLLRDGGYLNLLIPSFRLYELFLLLAEANLPPRFATLIHSRPDRAPKLCAVTAIRNVPGPLQVERSVFINSPEGGYTREVEDLLESFL